MDENTIGAGGKEAIKIKLKIARATTARKRMEHHAVFSPGAGDVECNSVQADVTTGHLDVLDIRKMLSGLKGFSQVAGSAESNC